MCNSMITILLLLACSVTNALEAHDVGFYHTKAFELLGEKYATTGPRDELDVMSDIADVLNSFCEDPMLELKLDFDCETKVYEMTEKMFHVEEKQPQVVGFPSDFDPHLRKNLEMIQPALSRLDENNFDEVLNSLTKIHNEILNSEQSNEAHKLIAISGSSIAIESLKLWHGAFTEPKHFLRNLISYRQQNDRELQSVGDIIDGVIEGIGDVVEDVIEGIENIDWGVINHVVNSDVVGAIGGTFNTVLEIPFIIISPPLIPIMALYFGVLASARAAADPDGTV